MIVAVAGPPGVGKTNWIRQQLAAAGSQLQYFSPGNTIAIDSTCIAAEFPTVQTLSEGEDYQLLIQTNPKAITYIELGFHLDLEAVELVLSTLDDSYHRVAVLPPNLKDTEWHNWANEVVEGATVKDEISKLELWRATSSGQVLDPASLEIFWYELTKGAYGNVTRAKGIFELVDGYAFYFNFVVGMSESSYTQLDLQRWLKGRPERFSGIEVVGIGLDKQAIAQTLQDCCLSDAAITHYQQQFLEIDVEIEEP